MWAMVKDSRLALFYVLVLLSTEATTRPEFEIIFDPGFFLRHDDDNNKLSTVTAIIRQDALSTELQMQAVLLIDL